MPSRVSWWHSPGFLLGLLVAAALISRGLFLWEISRDTGLLLYNHAEGADMRSWIADTYDRLDHGFMTMQQHLASLKHIYCDWLALIFMLSGSRSIMLPIIIQLLLGGLNGVLIAYLGGKIFNRSAIGLIAAALYTLTGIFWMYEVILIRESLSVTFFLAILAWLYSVCYPDRPERFFWWKLVALGATFSLAGSFRYNFYPVSLAVLPMLWFRFRKQSWRRLTLIGIVYLISALSVIAPVKWRAWHILNRNDQLYHYQGLNLLSHQNRLSYDLNRENSCDVYAYANREERDKRLKGKTRDDPLPPPGQAGAVAESRPVSRSSVALQSQDSSVVASDTLLSSNPRAEEYSPVRSKLDYFVGWMQNKLEDSRIWFGSYEIPENVCYYQFQRISRMMRLFPLNFALLWPWAILGLILAFRIHPRIRILLGMILLFSATFILTIITSRYRLPILAALTLPASYALVYGFGLFKNLVRNRNEWIKTTVKLALMPAILMGGYTLFEFNQPETRAIKDCFFSQRYFQILMQHHRYPLAEREAAYANRHFKCEYSIVALGQVYTRLNQPEKALMFLKEHENQVLDLNYTQWLYLMGINSIKLNYIPQGRQYLEAMLERPDMTDESRRPILDFLRQLPNPDSPVP